jgi:hypothetical protein
VPSQAAALIEIYMETGGNYLNQTTIYVSTQAKLNASQTQGIADELLRIIGYSDHSHGVQFRFIEEDGLTQAHASVDKELRVSVNG